ncbi:hypothetical protein Tco_1094506 [Tanacetum coccineum]|uniref:Uncharacterized protein n=1 Tax=Tanacetum coccineum TaxID=301880 RepID=A0ABQ5IFP7_9ASTR
MTFTNNSIIEDKKPSELILPPMDILETSPCVKDVDYITRDLVVSSVRISTLKTTLEDIQVFIRIFSNLKTPIIKLQSLSFVTFI